MILSTKGRGAVRGIFGAVCTKGQRGGDRIGNCPDAAPFDRMEGQS